MINQTTLIRADLFSLSDVGSLEQRRSLIEEILIARDTNPQGIDMSNPGCWRMDAPCKDINWLLPELNKLVSKAVDFYSNEDPVFAQVQGYRNIRLNYWANVNKYGSRNSVHTHKPSHFSAVYYLKAENTGPLRMINPANIYSDCNATAPFVRNFEFNPRDGDLILWPAWMPHEVDVNWNTEERINIVFDIRLEP